MRRMYSKEQLQKLIDEVSRLIAIEELDKVVPVPTLADAGKVMIVNAAGTGYELKIAEPLLMENIEDSEGHKRFIEGNITGQTISGVSYTYGKWSLSGTHLMIVLAGNIADETVLGDQTYAQITLPAYIMNKIFAVVGSELVAIKAQPLYDSNFLTQTLNIQLRKISSTQLAITGYGLTLTADRSFRIEFDLLIDSE